MKIKLLPAFVPRVFVSGFLATFTTNLYMVYLFHLGYKIRETYTSNDPATMHTYWFCFAMFYSVYFFYIRRWIKSVEKSRQNKEKQ
jgi:hypothetical protein